MAELELRVDADTKQKVARFKLLRTTDGSHLGSKEIRLPEHSSALWEGLFDTRRYIERYEGSMLFEGQDAPATAYMLLERLGLFLGQTVLGESITRALSGAMRHTLVVRLPTTDENMLAAAFARVPWEIARLSDGTRIRNLVVRAVTESTAQGNADVIHAANAVKQGQALRVLAVFAEAPGSRPLAMRREREELRQLFADRILPHHNVEIDLLCHGVTRKRIREAIRSRRGYHIVHWSGHGHYNALQLLGEPNDCITGEALVELFIEAGGFIPQLFFLSACHSGAMLQVKDWQSLQEALEQEELQQGSSTPKTITDSPDVKQFDDSLDHPTGYTGTALALLKAGVPQVVAMRYAVGDEYARQLAVAFYTRLLTDRETDATDDALAMARADVREDTEQNAYHAIDHATPLMFGQPGVLLEPTRTRSQQMNRLRPKPQPLLPGGRRELDPPEVFVGRDKPLTQLGDDWLSDEGAAVALIQGLAGLGKTALAAEAIHLWHERFEYVFAFQAKPDALQLDDFCRQLDQRLTFESPVYRTSCEQNALNHIHLEHNPALFPEPALRYERMRANLIEALRSEAMLLVLDNFESNLEGVEHQAGSAVYRCSDVAWDTLLTELAQELSSTRSRLLMTSRHRPHALSDGASTFWIALGALPIGEAGLFVRSHPALRKLLFSQEENDRKLIQRLLKVSRGHPLILTRFGSLAEAPSVLSAALDRVKSDGWEQLPDLFATDGMDDTQREQERAYLEDVAIGSVDLLLSRLTPDARRLLRVITVANEPVSEELIDGVWQGKSVEDERLERLQQRPEHIDVPPIGPLLTQLHGTGLLTKEELGEGQAIYAFHELVRERVVHWSQTHQDARDGRTEEAIRIAYGERYASLFYALYHEERDAAGEAGRRALVYFVAAHAFDRLGSFASQMVGGINNPTLLRSVVAQLEGVIDQVPSGESRWRLRLYVADALDGAGQSDQALPFYSQAASEAEAAEHWSDVAWILGNWAVACVLTGNLDESRQLQLRSTEVSRRAGRPDVYIVASELEALRIDVYQGAAETALPQIESRLGHIRDWWQRNQKGASVPQAPNRTFLGRVLVGGLDIAMRANQALERWQVSLDLLKEQELVQRAVGENEVALAHTRFNRYYPLMQLGQLKEAQLLLEGCLSIFRTAGVVADEARCLSALAEIWDTRGETGEAIALEQRALAVRNTLPNPSDRAVSHDNLSTSLEKAGSQAESARHQVAALVYWICIGERSQPVFRNLGVHARDALAAGERYTLPRLEAILVREEFIPLRQFLDSHHVDGTALQAELDRLVEQAHEEVTQASGMPPELA